MATKKNKKEVAKAKEAIDEHSLGDLINLSDMRSCLAEMEPTERVKAYLRLMEFVVPKKQSIAQNINTNVKDDAELLVESMMELEN